MVDDRSREVPREEWNADWIWCEGEACPTDCFLYTRKAFKLAAKPAEASLRIAAISRYKLFVNGNYVGKGPVTDSRRPYYDTYDIAQFLTKGSNAIAVLAYNNAQRSQKRPGLVCEAEINWNGGSISIATDDTWRVLPAEAISTVTSESGRRYKSQEVFDARLTVDKWTEPSFRDSKWPKAVSLGKPSDSPLGRPAPQQIPRPRVETLYPVEFLSMCDSPDSHAEVALPDLPKFMATEALKPLEAGKVDKPERMLTDTDEVAVVNVPQDQGVTVIVDFGREVFGCVELAVTKSAGGTIDVGYDIFEDEDAEGDSHDFGASDRVILSKGAETWTSFAPRQFRYIQLDFRGCPKPVSVRHIAVRSETYPVEWKGSFESSDAALSQAWKVAANRVLHRMGEVYADRPERGRPLWWDEPGFAAGAACCAFGDGSEFAQELRQVARYQRRDGALVTPERRMMGRSAPDFGAVWVMSLWSYIGYSGDSGLLSQLYPAAARWLKWIGRRMDGDILMSSSKKDLFYDWGHSDLHGEVALLNCLYVGALRAAHEMARALGREQDAQEWNAQASALRIAIRKHFWSPQHGLFADVRVDGQLKDLFSSATNILAALFDVADHYQKSSIYRQLLDEKSLPPVTDPFFSSLLLVALCRSGDNFEALDVIRRKWGRVPSEGVSEWERSIPSAIPSQLQTHFLGVTQSIEPGRVQIEPHPSDIESARGTVPTAGGPVNIEWKVDRRGFTMTVEVPEGITAEIVPPRQTILSIVRHNNREIREETIEAGPGRHTVQVLRESMSRFLRRQPPKLQEVEQPEPLQIPPGRGDIETVEQMIQILTELGKEQPLLFAEAEEPVEAEGTARRGRRSRRRSKTKQPATQTEAAAQPETQAEEASEIQDEEVSEAEPAGAPRKRSSRRRRGRSGRSEEPVQEATEVAAEAETPAPVIEDSPEQEPQPSQRSRRRRRRPTAKSAEAETAAVEMRETAAPSVETPTSEPELETPAAKQSPRRRRRRSEEPVAEAASQVEVEEQQPPQAAEPKDEQPTPAKRRRRKPAPKSEPAVQDAAPEISAAPKEPAEDSNGKNRRSTSRRRRKVAIEQDAVEAAASE